MNSYISYSSVLRDDLPTTTYKTAAKRLKDSHYLKPYQNYENIQSSHTYSNVWINKTLAQSRQSQYVSQIASNIKDISSRIKTHENQKQFKIGNQRNNFKEKLLGQIDKLKQKSMKLEQARKSKNSSRIAVQKSFYQDSRPYSPMSKNLKTERLTQDCTLTNISSRMIDSNILGTQRSSYKKRVKLSQLSQIEQQADNNLVLFLSAKFNNFKQNLIQQNSIQDLIFSNPQQFEY